MRVRARYTTAKHRQHAGDKSVTAHGQAVHAERHQRTAEDANTPKIAAEMAHMVQSGAVECLKGVQHDEYKTPDVPTPRQQCSKGRNHKIQRRDDQQKLGDADAPVARLTQVERVVEHVDNQEAKADDK